ncbi:MAG TPA: hypothetical protein VF318_04010 [Dehalococcoidales bacterium]
MRKRLVAVVFLVGVLLASGCAANGSSVSSDFNSKLKSIVSPYTFNLAGWEAGNVFSEIKQSIFDRQPKSALTSQAVMEYFSAIDQVSRLQDQIQLAKAGTSQSDVTPNQSGLETLQKRVSDLKPIVEQKIAGQISDILAEQGVYNPLGLSWFKINFPPVDFKLADPLNELIISPRDKIQRIKSITLDPDMTAVQMEQVESALAALNVSAAVIQIGGLGATYPSYVADNADLRWTIDTAAHEWVHQYLAFKPLGFRYVLDLLGITANYDIDTINETVADLIGQEIGTEVYSRYYAQYQTDAAPAKSTTPIFDSNAALRQIRQQVDAYLAAAQIEQAEQYMNQQQQYLAAHGCFIRKLNQAYFAFYGTYADSPTSIDPTGTKIRLLRSHSLSIQDFLEQAAALTSVADLNSIVDQYQNH